MIVFLHLEIDMKCNQAGYCYTALLKKGEHIVGTLSGWPSVYHTLLQRITSKLQMGLK